MTQEINLKKIEKKAWISTFEDGITDIGIGLILLVSTICQMFDDNCGWVVYLVRFLRRYPLPEKEVYDVSGN